MAHCSSTSNDLTTSSDDSTVAARVVMDATLPPTIAIDCDGAILFRHGDLDPHLTLRPGDSYPCEYRTLNRSVLSAHARAAMDQCRGERRKVVVFERKYPKYGGPSCSKITAIPGFEIADGTVILSFEFVEAQTCLPQEVPAQTVISELEREVQDLRQLLGSTENRLDTANHDLRTSHQEALAANAKLQVSNRELATATRQTRQANGELKTLNRRLQEKITELEQAHHDLTNFFASTEMATLFLDETLHIKRITPMVEALTGIHEQQLGCHLSDFDHDLLQHGLVVDARRVLDEGAPSCRNIWTPEGRCITRRIVPYRTGNQRVEGVVITLLDITELKNTEAALRESEGRFREMADGLPHAVWVHGPQGEQELVNATFCEFFGVNRDEMTGTRWRALVHPEDIEDYSREFQECVAGRRPFYARARVKRADGQWRWLESWGKPRLTETGEFKGFVGFSTDVTEQEATEAALRESEERFRTLADNIAQLAWMADKNGRALWYNQRWFDYTGTTPEQMQAHGWDSVPHPDHLTRVKTKYQRCIETGEPWEDTFPMRGRDGRYRWFLSRALPTRDQSGQIVRWLGTNTDITEQRQAEQLLRESDQRKDDYLAMLGHELRNPLAGITTAVELVKLLKTDNADMERAVGVLERQSKHITQIVDGLLEVSRIARGKIHLEPTSLDLREVLENVMQDRIPHLQKRGLAFEQYYPSKPVWVAGDRVRLVQVFDNLMGNAIKFTPAPGSIELKLEAGEGFARVTLHDTGVGIRAEMLSRVFEPFLQETQDVARGTGGLGLGLALAKGLVELHGGGIDVHSEGLGLGTEFLVWLPTTAAGIGGQQPNQQPTKSERRVLIVEDNADAADTMGSLLTLKGHIVAIASSGMEALQALREQVIDVVLCDIGLPGMNGYEFARRVRADRKLQNIKLVAVTGYGQPEDRKRSMQAGFDEHLTKPVRAEFLDKVLHT